MSRDEAPPLPCGEETLLLGLERAEVGRSAAEDGELGAEKGVPVDHQLLEYRRKARPFIFQTSKFLRIPKVMPRFVYSIFLENKIS